LAARHGSRRQAEACLPAISDIISSPSKPHVRWGFPFDNCPWVTHTSILLSMDLPEFQPWTRWADRTPSRTASVQACTCWGDLIPIHRRA
jgi:hypothetical protein